jgi:hypothetical protein
MDAALKLRKEWSQKAAKMAQFGKHVEHDEAEACKEEAAAIVAWEEEAASVACQLHAAVVTRLQKELDEARSKLLHHSSAREFALETEVKDLRKKCAQLQARTHWESHYGWTLPGAFLLAQDGDCECAAERRLYGEFFRSDAPGGAGAGSGPGSVCGRGGVPVRSCSCGNKY